MKKINVIDREKVIEKLVDVYRKELNGMTVKKFKKEIESVFGDVNYTINGAVCNLCGCAEDNLNGYINDELKREYKKVFKVKDIDVVGDEN